MLSRPVVDEDEYSYPLHMQGSASPIHGAEEQDIVSQLHAVVAEVTGKPVEVKPKPRMGFLP